jgi:hypothetical protein
MLTISVKVIGLDLFPGAPEVRAAIRTALARSANVIKTRAELNLSGRFVRIGTGKLRRGMRVNIRETGQQFVATVKNIVFYGQILEAGAAAHKIPGALTRKEQRAGVHQKVLRFEAGGKTVFARSIVHPGLRPRRWFASAVQEALPDLQRIFEQELGAAVTKGPLIIPGAAA